MSLNEFDWSSQDYDGLFEQEIPYKLLQNPLLQKDIWRPQKDLGLEIQEHNRVLTLNFSPIEPKWLKLLAKLYIITRANLKISALTINLELYKLKKLSQFLKQKHINHPKYLNNQLFDEFDYWIRSSPKKLSEETISIIYSKLNIFLTTCRREKWLEINTYWFQGRTSYKIKVRPKKINYIPEEVWNQLEEHLYHFPAPMQRKVVLIRSLGLRIGELLNLPLDCLRKRGEQWRLRLKETEKFKVEDELILDKKLVLVIKEQQGYIREKFGNNYQHLFCSTTSGTRGFQFKPIARIMKGNTFNYWLNRLANQYKICSKDGKIWHFASHQFRRTVATTMTNAGVRDLIIQKYLRHRNPDMKDYYTHLLKAVIGDEYQELITEKNFVNIEGKVATHKPQDAIEEYMRLRLHQITTQQGECHRSNLKKPCPTVNACWRCQDWMTSEKDLSYLKEDVERLKDEWEKANKLGLVRVTKEVQKDINYLQVRIDKLEEIINNGNNQLAERIQKRV